MGKRLLILICLIGVLSFLGISFVSAQCVGPPPSGLCEDYCADPCREDPPGVWVGYDSPPNKFCMCSAIGSTNLEDLLDDVIKYVFVIATAITPILIIIGGFLFMTSGGSIEKVSTAKRIITYTVIGYAIVLFSRGLVYVLADLLGK